MPPSQHHYHHYHRCYHYHDRYRGRSASHMSLSPFRATWTSPVPDDVEAARSGHKFGLAGWLEAERVRYEGTNRRAHSDPARMEEKRDILQDSRVGEGPLSCRYGTTVVPLRYHYPNN